MSCAAACSTPGTQHGVYISFNDGAAWQKFSNGLPDVPVTDLVVEDNAIAIGTHGRSFYVMDDIAALRQFGLAPLTDVAVFKPANATRGLDRPIVTYFLKSQPKQLTIDFLDAKGQVVRSITGQPPRKEGDTGGGGGGGGFGGPAGRADGGGREPLHLGPQLNRRRHVPRHDPVGRDAERARGAARVSYQVRLTADGVTQTQPFQVLEASAAARSATPTCSSSGTSRAAFATRSTKRTSR